VDHVEIPLEGGNMAGDVTRVGDTVRKAAGPQTPTVHRLLEHVRAQGVDWVPRAYGVDDHGREILDFIDGEVAHGRPSWLFDHDTLTTIARKLRQWHDATSTFERGAQDVWWWPGKQPTEVICHVDFAPYNHVYRDAQFVGAIDFDICYPGPRLWDLAYTAYRYVPLTPAVDDDVPDGLTGHPDAHDRSPFTHHEQRDRLNAFLAAYAGDTAELAYPASALLGWVAPRLDAMADWGAQQESADHRRDAVMYRAHARWIEAGGLGVADAVVVVDVAPGTV
jgi:thiamine kinase-like enzyme